MYGLPSIAVLTGPEKFQDPFPVQARKVVAQYRQREKGGISHDDLRGIMVRVFLCLQD